MVVKVLSMILKNLKAKGTRIISTRCFFDKHFGVDYFASNFSKYFTDVSPVILASTWYEIDPLVRWIYDAAKKANTPFNRFVVHMSISSLETDLNGINKFLMKLLGTKRILEDNPQKVKSFMNFIELRTLVNKDGINKTEIIVPALLSEYILCFQEGFIRGILNICGNKFEEFNFVSAEVYIKDHVEFSRIIYEVKYR